jgi:hypothetical protein
MNTIQSVRADVEKVLETTPIDFGGGCSVSKATVLAYLIKTERIKRSIDIGVYRGRSFFPQAYMHQKYTGGQVLGIDPYLSSEAMEHDHKELQAEINEFANTTDFESLYAEVDRKRSTLGIELGSQLIRKTANAAVDDLRESRKPFGLIHIDGNHDTASVIGDVENYLPLLDKENGFLVLDDISWTSVKPAVDMVSSHLVLLYARVDTRNDYAVFWTGKSKAKKSRLRKAIAIAAEN